MIGRRAAGHAQGSLSGNDPDMIQVNTRHTGGGGSGRPHVEGVFSRVRSGHMLRSHRERLKSMSRRILLLGARRECVDLVPLLKAAGWEPICVERDALDENAGFGGCLIGIAVIGDPGLFEDSNLDEALARTGIDWIAVTTSAAIRNPRVARALANLFLDFHTLPLDVHRLDHALGHAHGKAMLRRQVESISEPGKGQFGMVGTGQSMRALYRILEKVVRVDAPVLISGESGTGKELVAQAVHRQSRRGHRAFVPVNCGAIPASLMQVHLFGHEKGSFTGAHQRVIGSLEAADGGTILLDEIGDLPLESQASLLRFLQESTIVRIGSSTPIRIDARVVAATHMDLAEAVRAGRFREDLYYRLNVLHVVVPALRARPEDIEALAQHVFDTYRAYRAQGVRGFSREAIETMRAYAWPGNVRELVNRVQKAMIMCEGALISAEDLGLKSARGQCESIPLSRARQHAERDVIMAALDRNTYNMAATARELGVSRVTLYRLAQRLAIRPRERRTGANGGKSW